MQSLYLRSTIPSTSSWCPGEIGPAVTSRAGLPQAISCSSAWLAATLTSGARCRALASDHPCLPLQQPRASLPYQSPLNHPHPHQSRTQQPLTIIPTVSRDPP